jgi:hypothetical protein
MAKRSRSVALFEVINKDKRFDRRGGGLPTPSWFKSTAPTPMPVVAKLTPPAPAAEKASAPVVKPVVAPAPIAAPPPLVPVVFPVVESVAAPTTAPASVAAVSEIKPDENDSWPVVDTNDGFAPIHQSAPEKRGRGNSPLTKTSIGIIAASALLVVSVGMGYARWAGRHPVADGAAILKGPAHPEVLNVAMVKPVEMPVAAPAPAATLAADVQTPARQIGLSYVVIHLYQSHRAAGQISEYLNAHGIACTVEHGIKTVRPEFYVVVGLTPFERKGTPEYVEYLKQIKLDLGKVTGSPQSSRAYRPQLIKWEQEE